MQRDTTSKTMAENPKEIFAKPTQLIPNKHYPDCQARWGIFALAETGYAQETSVLSDRALKNNEMNCPGV